MNAHRVMLIVALNIGSVVLGSCGHTLTPEEQQQVATLKQQLQATRAEIVDATKQQSLYSGGLLKSLLDVRAELLKTNEALLSQRVNAIESGAKITVVVQSVKDDPIRAAQLGAELEAQKSKRALAKSEADRYSGGLIQAMALITVATMDNTIAMLEQQHLVAKYGLALPMPIGKADAAKK